MTQSLDDKKVVDADAPEDAPDYGANTEQTNAESRLADLEAKIKAMEAERHALDLSRVVSSGPPPEYPSHPFEEDYDDVHPHVKEMVTPHLARAPIHRVYVVGHYGITLRSIVKHAYREVLPSKFDDLVRDIAAYNKLNQVTETDVPLALNQVIELPQRMAYFDKDSEDARLQRIRQVQIARGDAEPKDYGKLQLLHPSKGRP